MQAICFCLHDILFRVFLNWCENKLQLVTLRDVIWALVLTAGFVVGERVDRARRKKKQ